jgi:hemin uptake protein HemP
MSHIEPDSPDKAAVPASATAEKPAVAVKPLTRPAATAAPPRQWPAATLFGGAREIVILFEQRQYRLRITAQRKLILTA